MIRVCIVCSLRVNFNIDLSFSEMRRLYWIKFINAYTQREEEPGRADEKNYENSGLIRQTLLVHLWQNLFIWSIKFWIYEILLEKLKRVSTFLIFSIKIKLLENYQKYFLFYQKRPFCPRHFQMFVLQSSPLFSFFGHCWFYWRSWLMINTNVYGISMSLNWVFKTLIL